MSYFINDEDVSYYFGLDCISVKLKIPRYKSIKTEVVPIQCIYE